MATASSAAGRQLDLPDFCDARAVLAVVIIVELTAIVLTVAHADTPLSIWLELSRTSLFLLWVGLSCAAVLCALRRALSRLSYGIASAIALLSIALVVALVSAAASALGTEQALGFITNAATLDRLLPRDLWSFLLRNVAIGLIVGALALRYFYVIGEWRRNIEMQASARVNALQARIRPHFLYNSMNTIAALTRSNPQQAERAIEDLADLFRASLDEKRSRIALHSELEAARIYQRIEQLRLGERLQVVWEVDELPPRAQVPSLMLQPLLENAIYHGVEPLHGGGVVTVSGTLDGNIIGLTVRNPLPDATSPAHEGNRIALANIRERLALMYPGQGTLDAGRVADEYVVRLRFPYIEDPES